MVPIKAIRVILCEEKTFFGNPIISTFYNEKGVYKKILKKLKQEEYDVITLKEYSKKVISYCDKIGIIVEDEETFLFDYFTKRIMEMFKKSGPLNIGVWFEAKDAKVVEKIICQICVYCKKLTVPNYPRCRRFSEKILWQNGLKINLENTLAKFDKKCDSIINVSELKISGQEDDFE